MAIWHSGIGSFLKQETTLFEVMGIASSDGQYISTDNRFPVDAVFADDAVIGIATGTVVSIGNTVDVTFADDAVIGIATGTVVSIGNTVNVSVANSVTVNQGTSPWVVSPIPQVSLPSGYGQIHKFGAVPEMSQNTNGSIWDEDDTIYPWSTVEAGSTIEVRVVNPNNENNTSTDLDGDTVEIQGLDVNYNVITETVTISGFSVTTTNTFYRVYRAIYANTADIANSKRILLRMSTTTVGKILENVGQTLMAVYTIPAGKTGHIMRLDVTAQGTSTGSFKLYVREGGTGNFGVKHIAEVNGVGGPYQLTYPIPQSFPEKTDIDARMHTFSNNGRYTCTFDVLLTDN